MVRGPCGLLLGCRARDECSGAAFRVARVSLVEVALCHKRTANLLKVSAAHITREIVNVHCAQGVWLALACASHGKRE